MPDIKILHNCNHLIVTKSISDGSANLSRSTGNQYDVIVESDDSIVTDIGEVRNSSNQLVPSDNYIIYGHNKIYWTNNVVSGGYSISYRTLTVTTTQHDISTCPRCGGTGWYIDLVDNLTQSAIATSRSRKIAQEFIKLLLTEPGSDRLDPMYGVGLGNAVIGLSIKNDDEIATVISDKIAQATAMYKERQARMSTLPNTERLLQATIESIEIDRVNTGVLLSIRLTPFEGSASTANLII